MNVPGEPCDREGHARFDGEALETGELYGSVDLRASGKLLGHAPAPTEYTPRQRFTLQIANVLDAVPSSLQPKVKAALHTIINAENKEAADLAIDHFEATYGAKYPKAVEKVLKDRGALLAHFDFPAEHWIHLRTTNAIESTFATVRLRTRKTKGSGSRAAGLALAYKLLDAAQPRWRCVNAPHLVALARAGATFVDGFLIEREDQRDAA